MTCQDGVMKLLPPGPLVSPEWLASHLSEVTVLDASPAAARLARTIVGAPHFDIDGPLSKPDSLPHTMPSPEQFEREVRQLGVRADSLVVVYDALGVWSSPRAWWMFLAMGHERVAVLDGGLPAWEAAGLPTVPPVGSVPAGDFVARPSGLFLDQAETLRALDDVGTVVLDARPAGRFTGDEPEPRPGLRGGHMPGSHNLPFAELQRDGRMLPPEELRKRFAGYAAHRLVFSCGSGVTACILALGATLAGRENLWVYDGSWSEWGLPDGPPVAVGEAT